MTLHATAQAEEQNRQTRNMLLAETDFYALSDVTMSSEMQSYRQALRDITSHSNWPNLAEEDWPTKPQIEQANVWILPISKTANRRWW